MYTEDAELIDEVGERMRGAGDRGVLRVDLPARPGATIEIAIESLRFLSPDVAKEEGHTRVKPAGEPETLRRYTVLYVKQDRIGGSIPACAKSTPRRSRITSS